MTDAEEAARLAEFTELHRRAVAACVRRGCPAEDAERVVRELVEELGGEARVRHYTLGEDRDSVDRWYESQLRELAED